MSATCVTFSNGVQQMPSGGAVKHKSTIRHIEYVTALFLFDATQHITCKQNKSESAKTRKKA